jgi:hypothetical protein
VHDLSQHVTTEIVGAHGMSPRYFLIGVSRFGKLRVDPIDQRAKDDAGNNDEQDCKRDDDTEIRSPVAPGSNASDSSSS